MPSGRKSTRPLTVQIPGVHQDLRFTGLPQLRWKLAVQRAVQITDGVLKQLVVTWLGASVSRSLALAGR